MLASSKADCAMSFLQGCDRGAPSGSSPVGTEGEGGLSALAARSQQTLGLGGALKQRWPCRDVLSWGQGPGIATLHPPPVRGVLPQEGEGRLVGGSL